MYKRNKYICTIPFRISNKHGPTLQFFVIQKLLLKKNSKIEILACDNFKISDYYRIIKKNRSRMFKVAIHILPIISNFFSELKREKKFYIFRKELLKTRYYINKDSLISNQTKYDVAICGSIDKIDDKEKFSTYREKIKYTSFRENELYYKIINYLEKKLEIDNVFLSNEKNIQKVSNMEIDCKKINKNLLSQSKKISKWLIDSIVGG